MIQQLISKPSSWLAIAFVAMVSGLLLFSVLVKEGGNYRVISGDGVGYYSYLPHTFLDYSLDNQTTDNRFFHEVNGNAVNKYYSGTAISMAPFFVLGNGIAHIRGEEKEAFSLSYQVAISLAGWFYLLGGLLFLRHLLLLFQFSQTIISSSILLVFFGTNLFVYALWQPSMSHVYSFFWVSGFLYFIKKYGQQSEVRHLYWAAFFLGMVVLIRPLNGIIVCAIPFLLESKKGLISFFNSLFFKKKLVIALLISVGIMSIQSVFWYAQCGKIWVWSYANEGFEFANPHWKEFLFSFRKGGLVYTPLLLFSVAGAVLILRRNKFQALWGIAFSVGLIYLLSSWWNWYYGPSFGQRPLVDFYGFSGILIAYFLSFLSSKSSQIMVGIVAFGFVFLNLLQTYQFQKGIISSWDMTWEKYRHTFLKTSSHYQNALGGNNDIMLYEVKIDTVFSKKFDFEYQPKPYLENKHERLDKIEIGHRDYTDREYNFEYEVPVNASFVSSRAVYFLVTLDILDKEITDQNRALFVVEMMDTIGQKYHYYTFPIRSIPAQKTEVWKREYYQIELPKLRSATDRLKIYIWNPYKESFWMDNLNLKVLRVD